MSDIDGSSCFPRVDCLYATKIEVFHVSGCNPGPRRIGNRCDLRIEVRNRAAGTAARDCDICIVMRRIGVERQDATAELFAKHSFCGSCEGVAPFSGWQEQDAM